MITTKSPDQVICMISEECLQTPDDATPKSSDLERLGASMAYRLSEVMATGKGEPADRMEELLKSLLSIPAMKDMARDILRRLEETELKTWQNGVQRFLAKWAVLCNRFDRDQNPERPDISGWLPGKRAEIMLDIVGWEGNVEQFAGRLRSQVIEVLQTIIRSDKLDTDWLDGIFTSEVDQSRDMIDRILLSVGGEGLAEELASATTVFREKLLASPQLLVAVELMESGIGMAEPSQAFGPAWEQINHLALYRLQKKGLNLPGPRDYNGSRDIWSEEDSLVREVIYKELLRRISVDPASILRDQLEGKLTNSLCLAAEHRALDHIDYLTAGIRDIRLAASLDKELQDSDEDDAITLGDTLPSNGPGPAEILENNEGYSLLIAGLEANETEVICRRYLDRMKVSEVAETMQRSESWVTKTQTAALKKMRQHLEGSGVAKTVAKNSEIRKRRSK